MTTFTTPFFLLIILCVGPYPEGLLHLYLLGLLEAQRDHRHQKLGAGLSRDSESQHLKRTASRDFKHDITSIAQHA